MFFLSRPSDEEICSLRDARKALPFSYRDVGATRNMPPPGWRLNHMRTLVGKGRATRDRVANALFAWELLAVVNMRLFPTTPDAAPEAVAAILSRHFGIWSADFCRVIYVLQGESERDGAIFRTGFAYGTLPGHAVRGEELFSIEWHPATEEVWYDIFSFSRPATSLVRLVSPFAKAAQRRFALASLQKATQVGRSVST